MDPLALPRFTLPLKERTRRIRSERRIKPAARKLNAGSICGKLQPTTGMFAATGEAPMLPTAQLPHPTPEAQQSLQSCRRTYCRLDTQIITHEVTICYSHIRTVLSAPQGEQSRKLEIRGRPPQRHLQRTVRKQGQARSDTTHAASHAPAARSQGCNSSRGELRHGRSLPGLAARRTPPHVSTPPWFLMVRTLPPIPSVFKFSLLWKIV